MIKLGAHTSFSNANNYLVGAVETTLEIGGNTMMIFVGPPQTSKRVPIEKLGIEAYLNTSLSDAVSPEDIIAHGPYITNPANKAKQPFAIEFLTKELKIAEAIGIKYMVIHPGSSGIYDVETALKTCGETIKQILNNTEKIHVALETMSGKGKEIGINFDQLNKILNYVDSERVGICLDTCHVWDAGYDLNDFDKVLQEFDNVIGLRRLKVVHLNDSKNVLGSHKDRHANIGDGYIGTKILRKIVHHPKLDNINIILETPKKNNTTIYKDEIKLLLEKE